jgi:hypothetical protein
VHWRTPSCSSSSTGLNGLSWLSGSGEIRNTVRGVVNGKREAIITFTLQREQPLEAGRSSHYNEAFSRKMIKTGHGHDEARDDEVDFGEFGLVLGRSTPRGNKL